MTWLRGRETTLFHFWWLLWIIPQTNCPDTFERGSASSLHSTSAAVSLRLLTALDGDVVVAFSSRARIWGRKLVTWYLKPSQPQRIVSGLGDCSTIHSSPALFFFKVEISSRTAIPPFRPGSVHSGSASWDDCARVFSYELRVSSFLIGSHTMPGQRHSQPTPTSSGQRCMGV